MKKPVSALLKGKGKNKKPYLRLTQNAASALKGKTPPKYTYVDYPSYLVQLSNHSTYSNLSPL
jgi:hypothetical protein